MLLRQPNVCRHPGSQFLVRICDRNLDAKDLFTAFFNRLHIARREFGLRGDKGHFAWEALVGITVDGNVQGVTKLDVQAILRQISANPFVLRIQNAEYGATLRHQIARAQLKGLDYTVNSRRNFKLL